VRSDPPVEQSCNGVAFENYTQWFAIAYAFSLVNGTALSMPCGFTRNYLPVGLQVVACPRAEASLLAGARLFEEIFELRGITPIEPRVMHL